MKGDLKIQAADSKLHFDRRFSVDISINSVCEENFNGVYGISNMMNYLFLNHISWNWYVFKYVYIYMFTKKMSV